MLLLFRGLGPFSNHQHVDVWSRGLSMVSKQGHPRRVHLQDQPVGEKRSTI
jgi:hypothetical protein